MTQAKNAKGKFHVRKLLPSKRRLIQLYAALIYNAHLTGFFEGKIYTGAGKNLCVPGLNCYSCPGAVGACPLGALQNALASSGHRFPSYILGTLALFGLLLSRVVCGFLCPMGLIQELLFKLRTPKLKKSRATRALSYLKYAILAVFVIGIPLWYAVKNLPVPAFCKNICPAGTLEGAVALLSHPANTDMLSMLGALFTRKFLILLALLCGAVFIYRIFCRFLCPLGAIYGFFARIALLGVKVEKDKCIDCGKCVSCCGMDIKHIGDHECIHCGACMEVCPTKAIVWKKAPKKSTKPLVCAAFILLICVLWFANRPSEAPAPIVTDSAVGYEVGDRAPDFTAPLYGTQGDMFTLSDHLGTVTVLNFWATWCAPCCTELPYFQKIYDDFGGNINVIALHSDLVTDDPEAYLFDLPYTIKFGLDETGEIIAAYNGGTMLPQTVVIAADGSITYNAVGSMTYETLQALVSEALNH